MPSFLFYFIFRVHQRFFHLNEVLRADREAPQAQLQILQGVGRIAHRAAADGHGDPALPGSLHLPCG